MRALFQYFGVIWCIAIVLEYFQGRTTFDIFELLLMTRLGRTPGNLKVIHHEISWIDCLLTWWQLGFVFCRPWLIFKSR